MHACIDVPQEDEASEKKKKQQYVVALAAVAAAALSASSSLVVSGRFTDFEWGRKNGLASYPQWRRSLQQPKH